MKLCVIGTGYVGLVAGACFSESGRHVICVDINTQKIENLRKGIMPIYEPGLDEVVIRNHQKGNLVFSTDLVTSVQGVDVCFIAVGTPPAQDGSADLSQVFAVAEAVLKAATGRLVLVVKSTVPVGTQDQLRAHCEHHARFPVDWVSNPEFLREGLALKDFLEPDRVVIGCNTDRGSEMMRDLYRPFVEDASQILTMAPRDAELCKYACNAMLATRISFMNDLANLCERVGANIEQIRRGMGTDHRIGHHFLYAGVGYGGSCFVGQETLQIRYQGRVEVLTFEELFERFQTTETQDEPDETQEDAFNLCSLAPNGLEALSWDPERQNFSFSPVMALTRRGYEGEIAHLRASMGTHIACTGDHPFYVLDEVGDVQGIKLANELDARDWLPFHLPTAETLQNDEINSLFCSTPSSQPTASDLRLNKGNPTARVRVKEVTMEPYKGLVYSLETAYQTVVTTGGLVAHNCFPKDTQALLYVARQHDYDLRIVQAVEDVNAHQKSVPFLKLKRLLGDLRNKKIALWGLAFKPETDDMREAPSIVLIQHLIEAGARVSAYDPVAEETAGAAFCDALRSGALRLCDDEYQALDQADALVLVTEWLAFRDPDFEQVRRLMRQPILIDGRNIYPPEKLKALGFTYEGIGRS